MAKIKIQKKDIWIDMTPMSDVMTLLLCFYVDLNILDTRTSICHGAKLSV